MTIGVEPSALPVVLDDFRLEGVLGRGGMGVVYRARQLTLDRFAAVKLISPERSGDAAYRDRFLRETRSAARVEHPHVVPIYQTGEAHGQLYLAMRLVEGPDLKALLAADGPFEPARAVRLVSQLADALATAHARGLVHRDVKPRNVLVTAAAAGEHAYLVDFGLARRIHGDASLTTDGRCAGTLDYMAPEVLRGRAAGAAADIYSLGCLLYELLMSRVPFPADNEAAKITAHLLRRPPRVTVRDPAASGLNTVVQRAMAKSPRDRFPTAADLAHAARRALDERPRQATLRIVETSRPTRARREPAAPRGSRIDADSISELLRRDDVRLVTLTDSRGVAETRLAIESRCTCTTPLALALAPARGTAGAPRGRVLLVVDDIDPLAALRVLATPASANATSGSPAAVRAVHEGGDTTRVELCATKAALGSEPFPAQA